MHFEALLSGDDLLAIWSLETLQLHQFMILSQYQNFADVIFTRHFFFKMHLCGVAFNSYLDDNGKGQMMGNKHEKGWQTNKN